MKIHKYQCNLCTNQIPMGPASVALGLYLNTSFDLAEPENASIHICLFCCRSLKELLCSVPDPQSKTVKEHTNLVKGHKDDEDNR